MLSPDQVASQGPGGFLNLNGGPTDPYYAQSDGAPWATKADACAAVPTAARRTRTVNVAGLEYQWLPGDLSNAGLLLKYSPGNGNSTPSSAGPYTTTYPVTQAGAQTITAGLSQATAIVAVGVKASDGHFSYILEPSGDAYAFNASTHTLTIPDGFVVVGQTLAIQYVTGVVGTGGGTGGPTVPTRDPYAVGDNLAVRKAVMDSSNAWTGGDLLAYGSGALQDAGAPAAIAGQNTSILVGSADVVTADEFSGTDSTGSAWNYRYFRRNDGTSGWTRTPKG